MRYLTGLIVFVLLFLLDVLITLSCIAVIGLFILVFMVESGVKFPCSLDFAKKVWLNGT